MTNSMRTVKVLAVGSCSSQLNAVLSVLRFFPCLEKLYVSVSIHLLLALNICSDLIGILSNLVSNIFNICFLFSL
jgi:hypothetical protein